MTKEIWKKPEIINWTQLVLDSYNRLLGHELIEREGTTEEQAKKLFLAPFVVLSHGTEVDPIYNYGNQVGLDLWEKSWDELIKTPSRLSAEPILQEERQMIIEKSAAQGYLENYQCVRISRTGKRYKIDNVTLWNVMNEQGQYCGQAATFSQWTILEEQG